jgi:hypothetical protein
LTSTVARLAISTPSPLSMVQRTSLLPAPGAGPLRVAGLGAPEAGVGAELRTSACPEAFGEPTDWVAAELDRQPDGAFAVVADVLAGGWFRVEVRLLDSSGTVVAEGSVEPVGVGEVFVVAGQSYAAGCHERHYSLADPMGRVVAASPEMPEWRYAHDPQPRIAQRIDPVVFTEFFEAVARTGHQGFPLGEHSPFHGSIWPVFGDRLLALERVPVALMHAAVSGTRIGHWAPGTQVFGNLVDAVNLVGDHRAVLWQQGESDVMHRTSTDDYVEQLTKVRATLVEQTGLDRLWLVAKSTHHTTEWHQQPAGNAVRSAHEVVATRPGFRAGPDTDALRGPHYRAGVYRGGHFTALGQETAGLLWAGEVHDLLRDVRAGRA